MNAELQVALNPPQILPVPLASTATSLSGPSCRLPSVPAPKLHSLGQCLLAFCTAEAVWAVYLSALLLAVAGLLLTSVCPLYFNMMTAVGTLNIWCKIWGSFFHWLREVRAVSAPWGFMKWGHSCLKIDVVTLSPLPFSSVCDRL